MNMNEQELDNPEKNSKFRSILNSFLADILIFTAALITLIITLAIIYVMYGQSKLKALVTNIVKLYSRSCRHEQHALHM